MSRSRTLCLSLLAVLVLAASAGAGSKNFDADPNDWEYWHSGFNWSPYGEPDAGDYAYVGATDWAKVITSDATCTALSLYDGGKVWIASGGVLTLWTLEVGNGASATLLVNGGGDLVTRDGYIGYYSSDAVTATISGSGSYWNADGWDAVVGRGGKGTLTIENGGDVLCEYATVGSYNLASNAATATITGSGSQWSVTHDFKVGDGSGTGGGYGTLNVLSSGYADVEGTMTVDDNATLYVNGGRIAIGDDAGTPANNHVLVDGLTADLRVYGRAKIGTASIPGVGVLYLAGDHHLDIIDGGVYTIADLYVGHNSGGTMTVSDGGHVSSGAGWVGYYSPSATCTATVTGSGSSWNTRGGVLRVGFNGEGTLNVEDGGHVISGDAYIGVNAAAADVTVTGSGSEWDIHNVVDVGYTPGTGELAVEDSGYADVVTRVDVNAAGTLTVDGGKVAIGTVATTPADDHVEVGSGGTLNVYGRAKIGTTGIPLLGELRLGGGHTLDVTGGQVHADSDLYIGVSGTGTMTVSGGGDVSTSAGWVGYYASSATCTATVTGSGSTWDTRGGILRVGHYGHGMLNVEDGGYVSSDDAYLGVHNPLLFDRAHVTITDSGSEWDVDGKVEVGYITGYADVSLDDSGYLDVATQLKVNQNGNLIVHGGRAAVGNVAGTPADGHVEVGPGGTLDVSGTVGLGTFPSPPNEGILRVADSHHLDVTGGDVQVVYLLSVGRSSAGTMTVSNSGHVTCYDGKIGYKNEVPGSAVVTVTGSGSRWDTDWLTVGALAIGYHGYGTLNVEDSGHVHADTQLAVQYDGTLNFDGGKITAGSATTPPDGTVRIGSGGELSVWGRAAIGTTAAPAQGAVLLAGDHHLDVPGGEVYTDDDLYVGHNSAATMTVSAGGDVSTSDGWLGYNKSAAATVTVTGAGSTWTTRGGVLRVGYEGKGTLNVDAGGHVTSDDAYIGANNAVADMASVTVTGSGSEWDVDGKVEVAYGSGHATLDVSASGLLDIVTRMNVNPGGTLTVDGGKVEVGAATAGAGELCIGSGGTFDTEGAVTVSDAIHLGSGGIYAQSAGSVAVPTFHHTAGGTFTFTGGELHVGTFNGNLVTSGGWVCPGASPGTTQVNGNVVVSAGGVEVEIEGPAPGSGYDQVHVTGAATLGGTLDVGVDPGYTPAHATAFQVMTFGSRGGTTFDTHAGLDLGSRLALVPTYGTTDLVLTACQGGSGEWAVDADGAASVSANWSAGLPNGVGDLATFGSVITGPCQVTVDVATVLGGLVFDSAQAYTVAGPNALILDADGGPASIDVANLAATHVIGADTVLADALEIDVATLGALVLDGLLDNAASQTITKTGDGLLVIDGPQAQGPCTLLDIRDGTVEMNTAAGTAGAADLSITVWGDAVLEFGANQYLDTLTLEDDALVRLTGPNVVVLKHLVMDGIPLGPTTLTPEPATLALLALGGVCLASTRRRTHAP